MRALTMLDVGIILCCVGVGITLAGVLTMMMAQWAR